MDFVGRLTDAQMLEHLARCRAVVFLPWNEDYGFEAFACTKGVITCTDSGGPAELVRDGSNGFVTAPDPEPLAVALRRASSKTATSLFVWAKLGAADVAKMTWPAAVRRLIA